MNQPLVKSEGFTAYLIMLSLEETKTTKLRIVSDTSCKSNGVSLAIHWASTFAEDHGHLPEISNT